MRINEQIPTYLNLSISMVDPSIKIENAVSTETSKGVESGDLLKEGTDWTQAFVKMKNREHRQIKMFGDTIKGHSVLICKFLIPQRPPEDVVDLVLTDHKNTAIERVARFVSLIPFLTDSTAFKDFPDVYCTSQEFLDLCGGGYEEHAILLCNYFNYIDRELNSNAKSYLIYGQTVPGGNVTYVLRKVGGNAPHKDKEYKEHQFDEIWDPLEGICYKFEDQTEKLRLGCFPAEETHKRNIRLNDAICTLKKVHCIIGPDDVWANASKEELIELVTFNIYNDKKTWKNYFTKARKIKHNMENQWTRENVEELEYQPKLDNVQILEQKIQNYLIEQFQDERIAMVQKPTKWDFSISKELSFILSECETHRRISRQGSLPDDRDQDIKY